jgi:hypothetical protein
MKRFFGIPFIPLGLILTLLCLETSAHLSAQNRTSTTTSQEKIEYLDLGMTVDDSIFRWKTLNRIDISEDARVLIRSGFLERAPVLRKVFDRLTLGKGGQDWLVRALVDHYFYDLRDRQSVRLRRTSLPSALGSPSFARSLAANASSNQIVARVQRITVEDVRTYLVAEFFTMLRQVLDGSNPGRLEVVSTPDQASIAIDGVARGDTCRSFVVSPGIHEVKVHKDQGKLDCTGTVSVGSGTTERFCCPRGTTCSTGPDGKQCTAP